MQVKVFAKFGTQKIHHFMLFFCPKLAFSHFSVLSKARIGICCLLIIE